MVIRKMILRKLRDQKPSTLPEKVIRDADISAIGKKGSLKRETFYSSEISMR
jgi:hypothetical protein